jgi:uncharacterized protein YecE (DUF72 family)
LTSIVQLQIRCRIWPQLYTYNKRPLRIQAPARWLPPTNCIPPSKTYLRNFYLTSMNHSEYYIGCSGYYYPSWKNEFYPGDVKVRDWLQYYSTIFNTVELNGTFYRIPKLADLIKYGKLTPEHFKFSVKVNRYITHVLKLKDSKQQISDFINLVQDGLSDKLACILFQMPPSFHYSEESLERILEVIPREMRNVIEFRHISWWNADVEKALSTAHLTFCNVDFPGLDTHFIFTSPMAYLRMHGNPELFKSSYNSEKLEEISKKITAHSKPGFIYFNNTYYDAAVKNATMLSEIIKIQDH